MLSSEEHYKKNHNSLKILVAICHGRKNEDDSDIIVLDEDPWASMKASMYRPSLLELKNEVREDPIHYLQPRRGKNSLRRIIHPPASGQC